VLAAVIYFALGAFALPMGLCIPITLVLIWVYILVASPPPSAIRAGVVATLVLAGGLFGRRVSPVG
jgi:competence protein ComEC